ncbi:MAG: hypothetical protein ACI94Y_003790 [Maribacter sp.]|jgi:hypothetical protein
MEKSNQFIKLITVVIFASLMAAFVLFKSGCISPNETETNNAGDTSFSNLNRDLSEWNKEDLDTFRIVNTEYYALTKKMFPGSKMMLAITSDDIKGFLHQDALPENFDGSWMDVDSATFNEWKKQQELKGKEKMLAPSSKSGAIFEDDGE